MLSNYCSIINDEHDIRNSSAYMIYASYLAHNHDSLLQTCSSKLYESHLKPLGFMGFRAKMLPELALRMIHDSAVKSEDQSAQVEFTQNAVQHRTQD